MRVYHIVRNLQLRNLLFMKFIIKKFTITKSIATKFIIMNLLFKKFIITKFTIIFGNLLRTEDCKNQIENKKITEKIKIKITIRMQN